MSVRVRSLLATTAVAAALSHGLAGHAFSQLSDSHGMATVAAGLCVLLVTGLGVTATARPAAHHTPAALETARVAIPRPMPAARLDGGARASPTALMRFRN